MTLGATRWHAISDSNFEWERDALAWLKAELPDRDPWHAWTNFEFIDDSGRVNEVDALILSPAGLFLVEIKSRPGVLSGDAHTWTWTTDGRDYTYDNPLILTDRKAKRLASLLRRQSAVVKAKIKLPFVEPLVFLSSTSLKCTLEGTARAGNFQRGQPGALRDDGVIGALTNGARSGERPRIDTQQTRAIARALSEAGIRQSNKHRQVGDYRLVKLIAEGEGYQDWQSKHVSMDTIHRRVRIYTIASATTPEARASRVRQARREFEVLEGIDHPGILKVKDYKDTELGPALVFDHDPTAQRLDHFLRDRGARLTVDQRLNFVREIAETLKYAHSKRLYHRALGPQSIAVHGIESGSMHLRLMNWQTASRNAGASGNPNTFHHTTGTRHIEDYVEDPGLVYLAPEVTRADPTHGPSLDVFSLGAIAYHIFSGQPPATSVLELNDKLRIGQGLRLADVMDGCGVRLQELIQYSTSPDVMARYDTVQGFLDDLVKVEDELTAPDEEATADPSVAKEKERIEGGFTVVKRLGRGSSSDVLLVTEDGSGQEFVLKVASDVEHNGRLQSEGEIVARLHHTHIVEYERTLTVAGRTALLMRSAGANTLAEQLRNDGRLSLDLLQRFGEELISAINYLEDEGVPHRDIKPDNIGIAQSRTGKLQTVLFDFSLSRTPSENISAGTHPYLDPFLSLRRPPRWDLYAERFALAVTLYEMAVGKPPRWGDGQTSPAMLECEASIESDVFDPVTREPFTAFFNKALRRDYRERFDNAEEMLRAWREIFSTPAIASPAEAHPFGPIARAATEATTMVELGYSLEAQDVLERMGIHNALELLSVDRIKFRYLRGVGDKVRKEIRLKAKELADRRPDLVRGRPTIHDDDGNEDQDPAISIDEIARLLLPKRPAGDDRPEETALAHYLGLDDSVVAGAWPTLGEAGAAHSIARGALATALIKARERWLKLPVFTELRQQIDTLVESHGNVMTAPELSQALLTVRGCANQDDAERLRLAMAVVRAACEAEAHLERPRYEVFDHQPHPLVAIDAACAQYARQLGTAADACSIADPLLSPSKAIEKLEAVGHQGDPISASPVPTTRLLRLATAASQRAALSSRQEIYPRGMPAAQALRQSLNGIVGVQSLRIADLQQRVRGRYPDAAPLPDRPALDELLAEVGAPFTWDPLFPGGPCYVMQTLGKGPTAGPTTAFARHTTKIGPTQATDAAVADALQVEERLQRARQSGGFLVLTVEASLARHAEAELLRRFAGLQRISVDALLLRALRDEAEKANVNWNTVLAADAALPGSTHWNRLMLLVKRTLPTLQTTLMASAAPLLVVNAGLLARYELMHLLDALRDTAGCPGATPGAWLLLPITGQGLPTIDGVAVPLLNPNQTITVPQAWIENKHRAGHATPQNA